MLKRNRATAPAAAGEHVWGTHVRNVPATSEEWCLRLVGCKTMVTRQTTSRFRDG